MANNVPDSTDWLSTPLSGFASLEAALRCQVCKDFFKTPMITSCSHTFCSLCIRRALANDGKCPLCRGVEQEIKLRCNYSTEETVQAFAKARETALQLARNTASTRLHGQKRVVEGDLDGDEPETKRTRTSARLKGRPHVVLSTPEEVALDGERDVDAEEGTVVPASDEGNDEDEEYIEEPKDGLLPCPSCQKRMKDWQIWSHLESCPGPSTSSHPPKSPSDLDTPGQAQRRPQTTLNRLPPLNYAMLKDNQLRRKVADLGISSAGPRALVERRHKEYTTLWNANCDAASPKSRAQLAADLDVWERTLGGRAPAGRGGGGGMTAMVRDKDFDGRGWAARHRGSFEELIASARRSREEATKNKEAGDEVKDSGEEEEESRRGEEEEEGRAGESSKEEEGGDKGLLGTEAASDEKPSTFYSTIEKYP